MKKILYLVLVLMSAVIAGCDNITINRPIIEEPTLEDLDFSSCDHGGSGCPMGVPLHVLKFENPEDAQKVLVGYNTSGRTGVFPPHYTYNQHALGLYLPAYDKENNKFFRQEKSPYSDYLEDVLQICGTSPFIALTNDYYLVDWRWLDILPCCNIYDFMFCNDFCFVAEEQWTELTTLLNTWRPSQVSDVHITEMYRVPFHFIDLYRVGRDMEIYFGNYNSLYNKGLCSLVTWQEYFTPDEGCPWNHEDLVNMMDSLTNVYREVLVQAIEHNDLNKIAYEYLW